MSKLPVRVKTRRKKFCYIGTPTIFKLELACQHLNQAFDREGFGCFLVGSCLERQDFRDVDVRMIMKDGDFRRQFPDVNNLENASWEFDPKWLIMTVSIAGWLREQTGLPIDFQFQPQTFANKWHDNARQAIGMRFVSGRAEQGG